MFALVERLSLPIEVAILGGGRISKRLLDWCAQMISEDFKLIHLPDYDPIGLNEFARLRARLGERVRCTSRLISRTGSLDFESWPLRAR